MPRSLNHTSFLALLAAIAIAHPTARAQDTAHAAPKNTGRDTRNYPTSPQVQYQHMKLVLDIPDMATPRLSAIETLTIAPIATPIQTLVLDAKLMDIQSVTCSGRLVHHRHDGSKLTVTFDPPIELGRSADLVTSYVVNDPPQGLIWTPPSPAFPGRPAQLHSQGQSELNSYWFPMHDFPNVRFTSEIIATVPQGFRVISNGKLVADPSTSGGRSTFHWKQDKPHAPYLVSLVVGSFDVVDVARPGKDTIPMPVFVPQGRSADAAATFARTPEMVALFARLTDQPYPWDQYAQTVVWNFDNDGMENTSATTLWEYALQSAAGRRDKDTDDLISHELAHQWFGDLLTCKSWEHVWLNEGFATYFESLWNGSRSGQDAYFAGIQANLDSVLANDKDAPADLPAMASKTYADPDDVFVKGSDPYAKGSIVLHMLRERLGDDVFWRGIRAYAARYRFKQVETGDFRRVMEDVSGESLEQFFAQWCFRTGTPSLDVSVEWQPRSDRKTGDLVVNVRQTQRINGQHPAYALDLPIWIRTASGEISDSIKINTRNATAMFALESPPTAVAIDPRLAVAAKLTIHQPAAYWLSILRDAPTVPASIQASRAVAADPSIDARQALLSLARLNTMHQATRVTAVEALRDRRDFAAIIELCNEPLAHPDVRLAIVEAAGALATDAKVPEASRATLTNVITTTALGEPLPRSRAAALLALGSIASPRSYEILTAALDVDSDGDEVRMGAIDGLHALARDRSLPALARVALPGQSSRVRVRAIHAIADLARHDSRGVAILRSLLRDRIRPVWTAAGESLAALDEPASLADLRLLADSKIDPKDRALIRSWMDGLDTSTPESAAAAAAATTETPDSPSRWAVVGNFGSWAASPSLRSAFDKDPGAFLAKRGLVARSSDSRVEIALDPSPESALGGVTAPIVVTDVQPTMSDNRVRVLALTLDDDSASRLRSFTSTRSGHLAILVDGRIQSAPLVITPFSKTLTIYGDWTPADAASMQQTLLKPGAIELHWTLAASQATPATPTSNLGSQDKPE